MPYRNVTVDLGAEEYEWLRITDEQSLVIHERQHVSGPITVPILFVEDQNDPGNPKARIFIESEGMSRSPPIIAWNNNNDVPYPLFAILQPAANAQNVMILDFFTNRRVHVGPAVAGQPIRVPVSTRFINGEERVQVGLAGRNPLNLNAGNNFNAAL